MSRLDKIIALVVASISAGCVGLVSQSATAALLVAFGAWALLSIGMESRPRREIVPRRQQGARATIVRLVAVVIEVVLIVTAPAALVGSFGEILPESWRDLAKVAVVVAVLAMPTEWLLRGLVALAKRARARALGRES